MQTDRRISLVLFLTRLSVFLVILLWTVDKFLVVSTLSTAKFFLAPFSNLLYFAGWPMLAACVALYSLRDLDTIAVS
ncbi:MAG: hypothetical protein A2Z31_10595 [candidate division NC10 bacterium RBG_16_65_8]|nr:MAG: hypothetical protein A2Z31_10595 [candidate division NC10 bacterium RBG_16_65_8]